MSAIGDCTRMCKAALAADDPATAGAEVRAYVLDDVLHDLARYFDVSEAHLRKVVEKVADADIAKAMLREIFAPAHVERARRGGEDVQAAADALAVDVVRNEYDVTLDPRKLFAIAAKADQRSAIGFAPDAADPFHVSVARLNALGKNLARRKVQVRARLVLDDVRVTLVHALDIPNKAQGWSLVVEWTATSGARGYVRFVRAERITRGSRHEQVKTYELIPVSVHVVIPTGHRHGLG